MFIRLGVAVAILVPFFLYRLDPPIWQIAVAATFAFGAGRLVEHLVRPADQGERPVGPADQGERPVGPSDQGGPVPAPRRPPGVSAMGIWLAVGAGAIAAVVYAWAQWTRESRELARRAASIPAPAPAPVVEPADAAPAAPAEGETDRTEIDLGRFRVTASIPREWERIGPGGPFLRASPVGSFLTDSLSIGASCLGDCARVRKNLRRLARAWMEEHAALRIRFTMRPGTIRQRGPGRVAVEIVLDAGPDSPAARAHVEAIHPDGADQAIVCSLIVFGDAARAAELADVCGTIELVGDRR